MTLDEKPIRVPRGHTLFRNYTSNWGRYEGWSKDDLDRINSFVERHGMQVTGKHSGHASEDGAWYKKVRIHTADGRVIDVGDSLGAMAAQRAVASLVYNSRQFRDFPDSREHYEERERQAREVFGDEYDAMVNPPKPGLLRRLFAR